MKFYIVFVAIVLLANLILVTEARKDPNRCQSDDLTRVENRFKSHMGELEDTILAQLDRLRSNLQCCDVGNAVCADIVFAFETSCSVDDETKAVAKKFVEDFISTVRNQNVTKDASQFGMLAFNADARIVFPLGLPKAEVFERIENFEMETLECQTLTQKAINMAMSDFFETEANNKRLSDLLIVFTDGRTQPQKYIPQTTAAIKKLRESAQIIVIELPNKKGRETLPDTLEQLNTLADDNNRFKLDSETDTKELSAVVLDHLLDKSEFVCPSGK